jgi:hypothetical protein
MRVMNREYNPKILRDMDRLCIYKCNNCNRIIYLGFDAKNSKTPVTCKSCEHYIDVDKDIIGDSWYPDEYPEVRFTIDEDSDKNKKPMLVVWFHMECRDCKHMSWIAWRGKWFDYTTCICHEPLVKEEAPPVMTIVAKPSIESIVIERLVIPAELVGQLRDHCFDHDTTKKDVIIEALRRFLEKCEDEAAEHQTAKFTT